MYYINYSYSSFKFPNKFIHTFQFKNKISVIIIIIIIILFYLLNTKVIQFFKLCCLNVKVYCVFYHLGFLSFIKLTLKKKKFKFK